MRETKPVIFLIAHTKLTQGMGDYLTHIMGSENTVWGKGSTSDAESLIEAMGRLCYRSWQPKMNPNVTKVREGTHEYIGNLLKSGHGSVLEHVQVSFIFHHVSRVFTHELVRHRAGVAISQESLRFVRLTELDFYLPTLVKESDEAMEIFNTAIGIAEECQMKLAEIYQIDKLSMSEKKKLTSMFRRIAPIGLATTIGWSCNLRALRHVIQQRTSLGAEEEIRDVFLQVAKQIKDLYPAVFQDMTIDLDDVCHFEYGKV